MHEQELDAVRCTGLGELRTAILGALPQNAVLRLVEECQPALDVHAWWLVGDGVGSKEVNSLSFHLSSAMVVTYLRLSLAERAERCSRLRAWVARTLDGGSRVYDGQEGFDISAVVPLNVFWPDDPSSI